MKAKTMLNGGSGLLPWKGLGVMPFLKRFHDPADERRDDRRGGMIGCELRNRVQRDGAMNPGGPRPFGKDTRVKEQQTQVPAAMGGLVPFEPDLNLT